MLVALTDFGDNAVTLPLVALMAIWLLALHARAAACWWLAAAAFCIGVTALLKIYFFACPPIADLVSPSGHTSLSTLVYGGFGLVAVRQLSGRRRFAFAAAFTVFIVSIAVSRFVLEAHSAVEIAVGLAIGLAALGVFDVGYRRYPPPRFAPLSLLAVAAILVAGLHGHEIRVEEFLHAISAWLGLGGDTCV